MTFPIYGKILQMFQTTNQIINIYIYIILYIVYIYILIHIQILVFNVPPIPNPP